jgi:hypothetical protein
MMMPMKDIKEAAPKEKLISLSLFGIWMHKRHRKLALIFLRLLAWSLVIIYIGLLMVFCYLMVSVK